MANADRSLTSLTDDQLLARLKTLADLERHATADFTIPKATHDKLRCVQDLMRHANPTGDPGGHLRPRADGAPRTNRESQAREVDSSANPATSHWRAFAPRALSREARRLGPRLRTVRICRGVRPMSRDRFPGVPPRAAIRGRRAGRRREYPAAVPRAQCARSRAAVRTAGRPRTSASLPHRFDGTLNMNRLHVFPPLRFARVVTHDA
jgi:hypothetical protein